MPLDLAALIPYHERMVVWKKSNVMFKVDANRVLAFWKRHADPLRGTIVKAYNKYVLISYEDPSIVHVSDIVKMLIYGEANTATVMDEHRMRVFARGLLYHYLFRKRFSDKLTAVFEFPITCYIDPFIVVGNIDALVLSDDGYYVIELKSSSTETTVNFGVIQVKIYWFILENFYDLNVVGAYVSTPKSDVYVDKPMSRREVKRLVALYAKASGRAFMKEYPLFPAVENHVFK